MSGAPEAVPVNGKGRHLFVVASRWHAEVTGELVAGATAEAESCGATLNVVRVPGAFEIPVVADAIARRCHPAGVVCLGVVVRGDTPHFDYVCRAVTDGCTRVALDHGLPVGFGVLTVDTLDQARERLDKGREAVRAVLETADALELTKGLPRC